MSTETGLIFFISALVILVAGLMLVAVKRASMRYLIYRVVPLSGFFGAFGLAGLSNIPGGVMAQAGLAGVQTFVILLLLHVLIGRHLRS